MLSSSPENIWNKIATNSLIDSLVKTGNDKDIYGRFILIAFSITAEWLELIKNVLEV